MADPGFGWLVAMCRRWLIERSGKIGEPAPFDPIAPTDAGQWTVVEQLARVHSVEPILFSLTGRECWEKVYYSHRIRNAEALTVLAELVAGCRHVHAPIVALKGPAAMADVYRDIGLRPMADLDVMCRPHDLVRVAAVARALGFRNGAPHLHHVVFQLGGNDGGLLELHFDLHREVDERARFIDSAWQHQTTATIEDWTFPVLSLEHQLVFDVAHWMHHDFDIGLKHVMDFAGRLLLHRDDLDWPLVTALLDNAGLTRDFQHMLHGTAALLQLPLAPSPAYDTGRADGADADFVNRLSAFGTLPASIPGAGVSRQPGLLRKTTFVWRRLFPPLVAAQAAFGSSTRAGALARLPGYAAGEILDLIARWRH